MQRKRTAEEERIHLLKKIRRLERKIIDLTPELDVPVQVNEDIEDGEIASDRENHAGGEEDLFDEFVEENVGKEDEVLEDEVLNILGVGPTPAPKKELLHKEIAERWSEILVKGLNKEEKDKVNNENPVFENVPKMVAPKLNKEVSAALNEMARKRDLTIENRQRQNSTALACVGQALQMCLGDIQEQKLKIIKKLNETGRLLCDSLFLDSKGRRNLILSAINKDMKDSLLETDTSEFLFGENLTDRIKTAKAVQKSGKDLKIQIEERKKNAVKRTDVGDKKIHNRALNWRGPPRGGMQQRPQRSTGPSYNRSQTTRKYEDRTPRRGKK